MEQLKTETSYLHKLYFGIAKADYGEGGMVAIALLPDSELAKENLRKMYRVLDKPERFPQYKELTKVAV